MPLYEYECPECGRFERIQKFSDPPLGDCPACGKAVQKLLSAPAIQFKGTGWYITDYARKGNGDGKREAAKAGSEAKSDSKTEAGAAKGDSGTSAKAEGGSSTSSGSSSTSSS